GCSRACRFPVRTESGCCSLRGWRDWHGGEAGFRSADNVTTRFGSVPESLVPFFTPVDRCLVGVPGRCWISRATPIRRANRTFLLEGGDRALRRRLRSAGVSGAGTGSATYVAHTTAVARCGGYRAVHSRPRPLDRNLHRIYSWRRSWGGGCDC